MPPDMEALGHALTRIVGGAHLIAGDARADWSVDGLTPRLVVAPETQAQTEAVVAACTRAGAAVIPRGGGSAIGLGNPPSRVDVVIGLERLGRIVEFDAANLNVTAEAGVRLADLQQVLAGRRQVLPLDPARADRRTVGGLIATNASGPSRLLYGTARDWVLGMRVVLAGGERIRCGGTVIKNVSGYDMNKLFIGSLGTLGIVTEATFKLLPAPAHRATVVGVFPELDQAASVVARALESFLLPEALEILNPEALAAVAGPLALQRPSGYGLAVGLAGSRETVTRQIRDFTHFLTEAGTARTVVHAAERSLAAWDAIQGAVARALPSGAPVLAVKIAVPIRATAMLLAAVETAGRRRHWPMAATGHAGSGIVRAAFAPGAADAGAPGEIEALRREAEAQGGSLVVEAAPVALKRRLDAWGTPGEGFPVMRRLKAEFDPHGILNPGRFVGGI